MAKPIKDSSMASFLTFVILGSANIFCAKIADNTGAKPRINDKCPLQGLLKDEDIESMRNGKGRTRLVVTLWA